MSTQSLPDGERAPPVAKSKTTGLEPLAVSPREACRLLGVSNTHFWTKVLPQLDNWHEGRARRISMAAIRKYVAQRIAENPQKPRRGRPRKHPLPGGIAAQPEVEA